MINKTLLIKRIINSKEWSDLGTRTAESFIKEIINTEYNDDDKLNEVVNEIKEEMVGERNAIANFILTTSKYS